MAELSICWGICVSRLIHLRAVPSMRMSACNLVPIFPLDLCTCCGFIVRAAVVIASCKVCSLVSVFVLDLLATSNAQKTQPHHDDHASSLGNAGTNRNVQTQTTNNTQWSPTPRSPPQPLRGWMTQGGVLLPS